MVVPIPTYPLDAITNTLEPPLEFANMATLVPKVAGPMSMAVDAKMFVVERAFGV